ncbi:MAG: hypothetical protein IJ435_01220 [Clostridia bacterium]|nr:hypothetical protein [Clostridia bacterium]
MKTLCIFLSAVMLFVLPSCGKREETAVLSQEEINELNNAYLKAKENGDYISMNKAKRRLGDKDYDYSYSGSLTEYDYSYTDDEGKLQTGVVYMLNLYNAFPKDECAKIADRQSLEENDFIVMDYSFFNNPCFQVRNSYKAENDEQIRKVIDILLRYDKEKNTPWERSKESMEAEWFLHNFSYEAQFETERAMHVDFDNKDEDVYK